VKPAASVTALVDRIVPAGDRSCKPVPPVYCQSEPSAFRTAVVLVAAFLAGSMMVRVLAAGLPRVVSPLGEPSVNVIVLLNPGSDTSVPVM